MPQIRLFLNTTNTDLVNGTVVIYQLDANTAFKDTELNELLYVVIVILFYATTLMVLIATQIRKQPRDGPEVEYYNEHLERTRKEKNALPQPNPKIVNLRASQIHSTLSTIVDDACKPELGSSAKM